MTTAQKHAQANFKKAIAYRKKTGCSLKEAFAHVKGHKVTGLDKVVKKGNKTSVLYTKTAKKKSATKKKVSQGVLFGVKKKAAKKSAVKSTHKDTKSHNVNIKVVSGNDKFSLLVDKGINQFFVEKLKLLTDQLATAEKRKYLLDIEWKKGDNNFKARNQFWKLHYPKRIKLLKKMIADTKRQIK